VDVRSVLRDRQLLIELFAIVNLGGLAVDIFLAHSENQFRRDWEYLPLYFSIAAAPLAYAGLGLLLLANRLVDGDRAVDGDS
jgi:hypothetical protein